MSAVILATNPLRSCESVSRPGRFDPLLERIREVVDGPHPPVGPRVRGARFKSALQDAKVASRPIDELVGEINRIETELRALPNDARRQLVESLRADHHRLLMARADARTHPIYRARLGALCNTYLFAQLSPLEKELFESSRAHLEVPTHDVRQIERGFFGRVWEAWRNTPPAVSVALQVGATAAIVLSGIADARSVLEVGAAVALARVGWEVADALGYVYHAVVDQVDPERCPSGMRDTAIEFQIHHHHPNIIREKDSMMVAERVACVLGPAAAGIALLEPGTLLSGFVAGLFTGALLSQECHKQAHFPDSEAPLWVRALRGAKMAIGTVEHGHHHTAPRNAYYSVLSGNAGRVMDMMGVNEKVDRWVRRRGWGFDHGETLRYEVDDREAALAKRQNAESAAQSGS